MSPRPMTWITTFKTINGTLHAQLANQAVGWTSSIATSSPSSTLATYSRRRPRFSALTRYFPPGATRSFADWLEVRVGQLRVDDARAVLHRRMPPVRTEDEIDQARSSRLDDALMRTASRYEHSPFPA